MIVVYSEYLIIDKTQRVIQLLKLICTFQKQGDKKHRYFDVSTQLVVPKEKNKKNQQIQNKKY